MEFMRCVKHFLGSSRVGDYIYVYIYIYVKIKKKMTVNFSKGLSEMNDHFIIFSDKINLVT